MTIKSYAVIGCHCMASFSPTPRTWPPHQPGLCDLPAWWVISHIPELPCLPGVRHAKLTLDTCGEVKDTPWFSESGEFFLKAVDWKENTRFEKAKDRVFWWQHNFVPYFTLWGRGPRYKMEWQNFGLFSQTWSFSDPTFPFTRASFQLT